MYSHASIYLVLTQSLSRVWQVFWHSVPLALELALVQLKKTMGGWHSKHNSKVLQIFHIISSFDWRFDWCEVCFVPFGLWPVWCPLQLNFPILHELNRKERSFNTVILLLSLIVAIRRNSPLVPFEDNGLFSVYNFISNVAGALGSRHTLSRIRQVGSFSTATAISWSWRNLTGWVRLTEVATGATTARHLVLIH